MFKKLGRFLKKIWDAVKKIIAVILAIIIVVVIVTAITAYFFGAQAAFGGLSNVTGAFLDGLASALPIGFGSGQVAGASLAVKSWMATEWIAFAATSALVGFGTMPNTTTWAVTRAFDGLRYIGGAAVDTATELAKDVVEGAVEAVDAAGTAIFSSNTLLIIGGGFLAYKLLSSSSGDRPIIETGGLNK